MRRLQGLPVLFRTALYRRTPTIISLRMARGSLISMRTLLEATQRVKQARQALRHRGLRLWLRFPPIYPTLT